MATTVSDRRETVSLIGSDKVEGTAVYGADKRKIGSVQRVMIDKISGKVAYAVVSFGGFLGMGEDYYPMPWSKLDYDTELGGYRVDITENQLKGARSFLDRRIGTGTTARTTKECTSTITNHSGTNLILT
jgi:PRC-barrel domain